MLTDGTDAGAAKGGGPKISALEWLTPIKFAVLLAVVIAASFPYVVIGWRAFSYGDASQFAYPAAAYWRECFWRGELPLWNPLTSCGIPFLAQWNTMVLYPPGLFYLLLPMPWSYCVFCLGHLFLGGMGMYFLAHRWTGNRFAAAVGGLIFAFNGVTWSATMWPYIPASVAWMPWILLLVERAWEDGGKYIWYGGFACGLQLLSGGAEVALQTWMIVGAFLLAAVAKQNGNKNRTMAWGAIPLGAGAGMAMAQILPFTQFLSRSYRNAGYATSQYGQISSMPVASLLDYFVPLFHCQPNVNGVSVPDNEPWIGSYFLGIACVMFALFAVFRVKDTRVRVLAGIAVFGMLMCLGSAGFVQEFAVKLIPIFGYIRFPVKYIFMQTFALPLLCAFGIHRLTTTTVENWTTEWKSAKIVGGVIVVIIAGIVCADKIFPSADHWNTIMVNGAVRCAVLIALLACIPFVRRIESPRAQRTAQLTVLLCAWVDILTHAPELSPTASAASYEPNTVREFNRWGDQLRAGRSRLMRGRETFWFLLSHGKENPDEDLGARRFAQFMNLNLLDDVPKFDGFSPLDMPAYFDIFKHVYFTKDRADGMLDFLGISEIGSPRDVVGWEHRTTFHPLITCGQKPEFLDEGKAQDAMFGPNFDSLKTVYLPPEAGGEIRADGSGKAEIASTQFSNERVTLKVHSDKAAMIVIAQTYYENWRAYVDGKRTKLWEANHAFQALEVPAGSHDVVVVYEDQAFRVGAAVSSLTFAVSIVMLVVRHRYESRTRRDRST